MDKIGEVKEKILEVKCHTCNVGVTIEPEVITSTDQGARFVKHSDYFCEYCGRKCYTVLKEKENG